MCSVQEPGSILMKEESASCAGCDCMKCGSPAVAVARMKDPFCKDCFHSYVVHRFRATFGKSRLVTTRERVLLAFSGGRNSRVMLALSEEGLKHQVHKKLRFLPTVIFVDEGGVLGVPYEERCKVLTEVLAIALRSGFPVIFTQLEQVYGDCEVYSSDQLTEESPSLVQGGVEIEDSVARSMERNEDTPKCSSTTSEERSEDSSAAAASIEWSVDTPSSKGDLHQRVLSFTRRRRRLELEGKLRQVFDSTATCTAKENLLLSLRHTLLAEVARRRGLHKILLGVNATQLAVRLLSNVSQGRGATLPLDVGFADTRTNDVMFLRPLREFPSTEVDTYATLHSLDTVTTPSLSDQSTDRNSIDHLTTTFITGLQADFPSTVNTVFRTGDKLAVGSEGDTAQLSSCSLCQAPLTVEADSSVYSHLTAPSQASAETWRTLCYGCRLTVKDMRDEISCLPPSSVIKPPASAKNPENQGGHFLFKKS